MYLALLKFTIFAEEIDGGTVMVFDIEKLELRTTRGDSSFDTVKVPTPYLLTQVQWILCNLYVQ